MPNTMYLAGKIGPINTRSGDRDWRTMFADNDFRAACEDQARMIREEDLDFTGGTWPSLNWAKYSVRIADHWTMTGPFPAYTPGHKRESHMAAPWLMQPKRWNHGSIHDVRMVIHAESKAAIERADTVAVWMDGDMTAFGTLWEMGYAESLGKRLVVFTPPADGETVTDLYPHMPEEDQRWMATMNAKVVYAENPHMAAVYLYDLVRNMRNLGIGAAS